MKSTRLSLVGIKGAEVGGAPKALWTKLKNCNEIKEKWWDLTTKWIRNQKQGLDGKEKLAPIISQFTCRFFS